MERNTQNTQKIRRICTKIRNNYANEYAEHEHPPFLYAEYAEKYAEYAEKYAEYAKKYTEYAKKYAEYAKKYAEYAKKYAKKYAEYVVA